MAGILALALGISLVANQDQLVTAEEQYKAIVKEFGEAANSSWKATNDEQRKQAAARVEPLRLSSWNWPTRTE